jgi:acetyl esterase/lipase
VSLVKSNQFQYPSSAMKIRLWLRRILLAVLCLVLGVAVLVGIFWWYFSPPVQRTLAVTYGQRDGRKLYLDVIQPAKPNGLGVLLLVSGGWKSAPPGDFKPWMATPLLRRGYTVFAIYHVSQPDATVMAIVEDMHRAARFVRYHAREYGVNPAHLGVSGGSAGGHLSLMLATCGGPGVTNALDPVDRESSAVQAVAIFFPVTDLLNLGASTENPGDGGPPIHFHTAFGSQSTNLAEWKVTGRDNSPIYHLTTNLPPVLILHGDADTLVPLDQSERFAAQAHALGDMVKLVPRHGAKHGWATMVLDLSQFADWFDAYLRPKA